MRIAKIVDGLVETVTTANDVDHGAEWLMENFGGFWVNVPDSEEVSPGWGWNSVDETFIQKPNSQNGEDYIWNDEDGSWDLSSGL